MFTIMHSIRKNRIAFIIAIILFIIPFFWIKPGEANMGGDGGSLYYYDSINLIKHYFLYEIYPFGSGSVEPRFYYLPFVSILALFKSLFLSPYLISVLHNSIKLSVGFFAIYSIVKILLLAYERKINLGKKQNISLVEIIAALTGIFYIFSPLLIKDDRYINPIPSHDQIFLNPLIFYLVLKFFLTKSMRYLWSMLLVTVIFAHNFSYAAVPALFSFYPPAFIFLALYTLFILKKNLPIKRIFVGIFFFVLLHLFHLGPEIMGVFDFSSSMNTEAFSGGYKQELLTYFHGVVGYASLSKSILLPPINQGPWSFFSFISIFVILVAFIKNKPGLRNSITSKTFLLTGLIFLALLYLISAKVTFTSVKLYEMFFLYVPGFGMFRNFYIQWLFAFAFFYSLLFGQALICLSASIKSNKMVILLIIIFVYLIGSSWTFIRGDQFKLAHTQTNNVKRLVAMDPKYEQMVQYIRNLQYDGNILQFPFTDFNYQVLHGTNNGAYLGTSTIGQLTGIKDFAGYWHVAPYSEIFLQSSKDKDYSKLLEILGLLNIRYIFHNSDPKIYDSSFYGRPFEHTSQFFPSTQEDFKEFIRPLISEKLFAVGYYSLYLTKDTSYLPHTYIPTETVVYKNDPKYDKNYWAKYYFAASSFLTNQQVSTNSAEENKAIGGMRRTAYIEKNDCINKPLLSVLCKKDNSFDDIPEIYYEKINPTKYYVKIKNVKQPFILVFSETFHKDWKLFINNEKDLKEKIVKTYFNGDISEGKVKNIFLDDKVFETFTMNSISEAQHVKVNAYANAWYINPSDFDTQNEIDLTIEMIGQRTFYIALLISLLSFCGFILWGIILLIMKKI